MAPTFASHYSLVHTRTNIDSNQKVTQLTRTGQGSVAPSDIQGYSIIRWKYDDRDTIWSLVAWDGSLDYSESNIGHYTFKSTFINSDIVTNPSVTVSQTDPNGIIERFQINYHTLLPKNSDARIYETIFSRVSD